MFTALLDTNVLWPSLQRDFLLSMAAEGIYRVTWSEAILDELEYETMRKLTLRKNLSEIQATKQAHNLRSEMQGAFPDATVYGWEALEGSFGLPDIDDEHVLAAAVIAQAGAIVTSNLKDFPQEKLPGAMNALSPQEFVENSVDLAPRSVLLALKRMSTRSGRFGPSQTQGQIAQELANRYGMTCVPELFTNSPTPD